MLSGLRRLLGKTSPANDPIEGTLVNAYATTREPPAPRFPHALHARRDRGDPELAPHLDGFAGYVLSTTGGTMTQAAYHLRQHIARVRHHLSFTVPDDAFDHLARWADEANAVLFLPDGSVRDPQGRVLASRGAPPVDPAAVLPYPADAQARKKRSMATIDSHGLRVTPHLPPVVGGSEVDTRSAADVLARASALLAVAVRAESLHTGEALSLPEIRARLPLAFDHLSPREQAFMAQDEPAPSDVVVQFAWRYEGVRLLEWALGIADDLPFPTATCDAARVTAAMLSRANGKPTLRSNAGLLDALDLHLRLHWITRQAHVDGKLPVAGVDAGVVQERHQALNWLLRVQDADWDDIDTPT